MNGYEVLAEEYWERKGKLFLEKCAQKLLSLPQIPPARLGIEVKPPLWDSGE